MFAQHRAVSPESRATHQLEYTETKPGHQIRRIQRSGTAYEEADLWHPIVMVECATNANRITKASFFVRCQDSPASLLGYLRISTPTLTILQTLFFDEPREDGAPSNKDDTHAQRRPGSLSIALLDDALERRIQTLVVSQSSSDTICKDRKSVV